MAGRPALVERQSRIVRLLLQRGESVGACHDESSGAQGHGRNVGRCGGGHCSGLSRTRTLLHWWCDPIGLDRVVSGIWQPISSPPTYWNHPGGEGSTCRGIRVASTPL